MPYNDAGLFIGPVILPVICLEFMPYELNHYVGRSAVFIETGDACVGVVERVDTNDERINAWFRIIPDSFSCHLRFFIESPNDDPIERILNEPPFGETWDISVSNQEFHLDDEHWQAAFLFGGGFRVFFHDEYVARFRDGDVLWLDEFYDGDDAES